MSERGGGVLFNIQKMILQRRLREGEHWEQPQTNKVLFFSGRFGMEPSPDKLAEHLGLSVGNDDIVQINPAHNPLQDPFDYFKEVIIDFIEEQGGRPHDIVLPKGVIEVADMAFFEDKETSCPVPPQRTVEEVINYMSRIADELGATFHLDYGEDSLMQRTKGY